jgi:hypothetical protein
VSDVLFFALLYASQELDKIITSNNDEKMGVDIIKKKCTKGSYYIFNKK